MLSAASIDDPFAGTGILSYGGAGGGSYGFTPRGYPDYSNDILGRRGYGRYDLDPIFDVEKYADSFEYTGEFVDGLQPPGDSAQTMGTIGAGNTAAVVAADDEGNLINDPLFWAAVILVGVIAL